jgi:hypothetical protein
VCAGRCGDGHSFRGGQRSHPRLPLLDARHDHCALIGRSGGEVALIALQRRHCLFALDAVLSLRFEQRGASNIAAATLLIGAPRRGARSKVTICECFLKPGSSFKIGSAPLFRQTLIAGCSEPDAAPDFISLNTHTARVDRRHLPPRFVRSIPGNRPDSQAVVLTPGTTVGDGHAEGNPTIERAGCSG